MDLYDYFHKKRKEEPNFNAHTFSDQLGISKSYLSMIINGRGAPSVILAFRIQDVTDGAVTFKDMMNWVEKNKDSILNRHSRRGSGYDKHT